MDSSSDLGLAVGIAEDARTVADLVPVVDELTERHVREVLWEHPGGFRVLASPDSDAPVPGPDGYASVVAGVSATADVVVLHAGRAREPVGRAAVGLADSVVLVVTLDVLGIHGARRVLQSLDDARDRCVIVVNRARRAEIVPADVERALGIPPLVVIPEDSAVSRAQNCGRLVTARGRAGRAVAALAAALEERPS